MTRRTGREETGFLFHEPGVGAEGMVVEVAPVAMIGRAYSFSVPAEFASNISLGIRVAVPLGKRGRIVEGFVTRIDRRVWESTLRTIDSVLDEQSYLSAELLELGKRIAEHYCAPLGRTLRAMTPQAVRAQRGMSTVRYARLKPAIEPSADSQKAPSKKRQAVLDALEVGGGEMELSALRDIAGASAALLRAMTKDGLIEIDKRKEQLRTVDLSEPNEEPTFALNSEQQSAIDDITARIAAGRFHAALLYGVSGSGKTEVYIQAIRNAVARDRQAIMLVPEIVLTTQLVQRLARRFENVAVVHSGLTESQRSILWREIASGSRNVVIGTRSAVFAPCPSLGLICVDEEQETSYKNMQAPRFHVRDVAILRAHALGIPVVLGSATPSLEVWNNSETREDYSRLVLSQRVRELPMPRVHVVDMNEERGDTKSDMLVSRVTKRLLAETLDRGEQAIVLMNRRGYARRVACAKCRTRLQCPNCQAGVVAHKTDATALCHYCRKRLDIPLTCPVMGCNGRLVLSGAGTERVEEVMGKLFPQARILRCDSDTMRHRDQYKQVVDDFTHRRADVLLGTQMIAKGLDFPFVSFVGVIDADPTALEADFRAQERLFQLLTQVAGRAGRADAPGTVVIQTTMPELPAIKCAASHDYQSFATAELRARHRTGLPPFVRIARIVVSHERESRAREEAARIAEKLRQAITSLSKPADEKWQGAESRESGPTPAAGLKSEAGLRPGSGSTPMAAGGVDASGAQRKPAQRLADVLGPNPCMMARLRGSYRYDLLLRASNASTLHEVIRAAKGPLGLRPKAGSAVIDVDPVEML